MQLFAVTFLETKSDIFGWFSGIANWLPWSTATSCVYSSGERIFWQNTSKQSTAKNGTILKKELQDINLFKPYSGRTTFVR